MYACFDNTTHGHNSSVAVSSMAGSLRKSSPFCFPYSLLDQVRYVLRKKHYKKSTEETYVNWIRRFIRFHKMRHPKEMGVREVEQFLTYLAVQRLVSASTQNQALNALVFLYKQVLGIELQGINAQRAKTPENLPVVFSKREVKAILAHLNGLHWMMAYLLYHTNLHSCPEPGRTGRHQPGGCVNGNFALVLCQSLIDGFVVTTSVVLNRYSLARFNPPLRQYAARRGHRTLRPGEGRG